MARTDFSEKLRFFPKLAKQARNCSKKVFFFVEKFENMVFTFFHDSVFNKGPYYFLCANADPMYGDIQVLEL